MKTILRALLIVAAALAVVGGLVFAVQSGWLSNLTGGFGRGGGPGFGELGGQGQPPTGNGEFRPPFNDNDGDGFRGQVGFGERGEREGRGSLFGLGDVFKNLAIMGIIFVVVVAVSLGGSWLLRVTRRKQPPTTPSPGQTPV